jgi:hypothetical protein
VILIVFLRVILIVFLRVILRVRVRVLVSELDLSPEQASEAFIP